MNGAAAHVSDGTLASAETTTADGEVARAGNAFAEICAGQRPLVAKPAPVCDRLPTTPAARHEAACGTTTTVSFVVSQSEGVCHGC